MIRSKVLMRQHMKLQQHQSDGVSHIDAIVFDLKWNGETIAEKYKVYR